jgi:hypothetical protein
MEIGRRSDFNDNHFSGGFLAARTMLAAILISRKKRREINKFRAFFVFPKAAVNCLAL